MQSLPPVENKGLTQTEDILNSILPPREWTHEGQLWVQHVSSTPATRLDVINLQEKLDQQLQQRQVRPATLRTVPTAPTFTHQLATGRGDTCTVWTQQTHVHVLSSDTAYNWTLHGYR